MRQPTQRSDLVISYHQSKGDISIQRFSPAVLVVVPIQVPFLTCSPCGVRLNKDMCFPERDDRSAEDGTGERGAFWIAMAESVLKKWSGLSQQQASRAGCRAGDRRGEEQCRDRLLIFSLKANTL